MTPQEFCYWLQGYFELTGKEAESLSATQVSVMRNHLNLVFKHEIDPKYPGKPEELQAIHDGNPLPSGIIARC